LTNSPPIKRYRTDEKSDYAFEAKTRTYLSTDSTICYCDARGRVRTPNGRQTTIIRGKYDSFSEQKTREILHLFTPSVAYGYFPGERRSNNPFGFVSLKKDASSAQ